MTKIAVTTDSNSGITQAQAKNLGIFVLPMPFYIDEETFYDDINLTVSEFYEKMAAGANILTSQPTPTEVLSLWDKLLKEYDEIVHIPMSSGLSGSCESALMLSQNYDGKVHVVNNQRISVTQRQSVLDALELTKREKSGKEIKTILEEDRYNSSIYIMVDTLYYLKKGGRITPAAAALGTLLKIKPILQIQGDKLDAFAKARTTNQGKAIMQNALKNDMATRFGGSGKQGDSDSHFEVWLQVAHSKNEEAAKVLKEELAVLYPECDIYVDSLSLSVACHIGPGALAIACCKKMDYDASA